MIKEFNTEINKKGSPNYYFILGEKPIDWIGKKIDLDKVPKYFHKQLKNYPFLTVTKNRNFKNKDIVFLDWNNGICVSKKFKDIFESKIKGYFYPTNDENYFVLVIDNCIDGLDRSKTNVIYHEQKEDFKYHKYQYIENLTFNKQAEEDEYLFSLWESPTYILCTNKFEKLCIENDIKGVRFVEKLKLKSK